jgi:hypothetical protein
MSISQSAIGVLGWLKKVTTSGDTASSSERAEMFPIQRGVQLEFDRLMEDSAILSHPTRRSARSAPARQSVRRTLKR